MTTHIDILKKGSIYWNEWRENNPDVIPDLIRADLQGLDLSEANLSKVNLTGAILLEADLSYSNLTKAILLGVDLSYSNLTKAILLGADLSKANLRWAKLREANLSEANLIWTNLAGASLKKVNLTDAYLQEVCLQWVNLQGANLQNVILPRCLMNVSQGDGKRIKTIHTETYRINIYDNRMQIGCQNHTIDEWFTFTDTEISIMAGDALSFWKEWKLKLQEITQ